MQKQYSELIDAPLQLVFQCITDEQHLPRLWNEQEAKIDFRNNRDFHDPVGSKFHQKISNLVEFDGEVLAYNPPREFGIGIDVAGLRGMAFYELTEIDKRKTRLDFNLEFFDAAPEKHALLQNSWSLFEQAIERVLKAVKTTSESIKII